MIVPKQGSGKTSIQSLLLTAGLAIGLTVGGWGTVANAASPQTRQQLGDAIQSLQAAGTAYAAGNAQEARQAYDKAKTSWSSAELGISKKEAHELSILFDTLGGQISKGDSADDIKSSISDTIDELRENMD